MYDVDGLVERVRTKPHAVFLFSDPPWLQDTGGRGELGQVL